jgi:predicted transposase YdaD
MVLAALGPAARALLEAQMRIEGYEYKTDFLRRAKAEGVAEGRAEGKAEGKAEGIAEGARRMLVAIFEARGWTPTPATLQRIGACTDEAQLERWARQAIIVDSIDEVFA